MGQNVPNLSHLPENVHKRFCAHPAEKQDALFCCSVNFHHWRYGFESLSPVLTDKTAAISEGKFRRGRHILPRRLLFVKKMFIIDTQMFFFHGFYNHSLEFRRISFVWYSFWHSKTPHLLNSISYCLTNGVLFNVCSGIFCFSDLFGMTSIVPRTAGADSVSARGALP